MHYVLCAMCHVSRGVGRRAGGSSSRNMAGTAPERQLRSELGCAPAPRFLSAPVSPPAAATENPDPAPAIVGARSQVRHDHQEVEHGDYHVPGRPPGLLAHPAAIRQ